MTSGVYPQAMLGVSRAVGPGRRLQRAETRFVIYVAAGFPSFLLVLAEANRGRAELTKEEGVRADNLSISCERGRT